LKITCWAIKDKTGHYVEHTISDTKEMAVMRFLDHKRAKTGQLVNFAVQGFVFVKMEITEVPLIDETQRQGD